MDDTKGIVVAKRRHAGSAPTTSAPLAWNGEAPENSRIVPQETHRPTSGELLLEGGHRSGESGGTFDQLGPAFAPRLLSQLRMFTPAGVTCPSS